jgi:dihydrofolate reductase
MAKLVYSALCSLDGYIADANGKFDWARPDDEVHAFVNELERPAGTHLYGRRMYEVMSFWETADGEGVMGDFAAIWRAADKIVYSRTLEKASTARTRIEREFDPEAVRAIEGTASIGGAELAGQAIAAGLVDECHLFFFPVVVGGGTRALPDGVRWNLQLVDERRFGNGVVYVHYSAAE